MCCDVEPYSKSILELLQNWFLCFFKYLRNTCAESYLDVSHLVDIFDNGFMLFAELLDSYIFCKHKIIFITCMYHFLTKKEFSISSLELRIKALFFIMFHSKEIFFDTFAFFQKGFRIWSGDTELDIQFCW